MAPLAAGKVGAGQQNLGHGDSAFLECFVVRLHQKRLANGSGGLFLMKQLGPLRVADGGEACGYGAGGNQQHLVAGLLQGGQLVCEETDLAPGQTAFRRGK
ncbi:hypothetical protein D3C75_889790 [compost metagenome]